MKFKADILGQKPVTERARKLRAQYTFQAQGVRTRLEIRIHRIPAALRKARLGDLIEKHLSKDDPEKPALPARDEQTKRMGSPAVARKAQHKARVSPLKEEPERKEEQLARPGKRRRYVDVLPERMLRVGSKPTNVSMATAPRPMTKKTKPRTTHQQSARALESLAPPPPQTHLTRPVYTTYRAATSLKHRYSRQSPQMPARPNNIRTPHSSHQHRRYHRRRSRPAQ